MIQCLCVCVFLTCQLPWGGTEAVRASAVLGGRQEGEEVGKEAKLVLADLLYHKTQIPKTPLSVRSGTKETQSYCKNTYRIL